MSGNGQRNAVLMANAARWCDAVLADAGSEAGRAAARRHGVAFVSIEQLTRPSRVMLRGANPASG